jgi:hypothetical protein
VAVIVARNRCLWVPIILDLVNDVNKLIIYIVALKGLSGPPKQV